MHNVHTMQPPLSNWRGAQLGIASVYQPVTATLTHLVKLANGPTGAI